MALSYRSRRRWSLAILVLGLPLYIVIAVTVIGWFERPGFLLELAIYVGLGILWVAPLRSVFRGIGKPDPNSEVRG